MLKLTPSNFNKTVLKRKGKIIILFYTSYCPSCRSFLPIFFHAEHHVKKIKFAEAPLDDDENPLWDRFNIEVVPTVIVFKKGKQIARRDGIPSQGLSEIELREILEEVL